MAPPYLFSSQGVGLIEFAALIGFLIACFGGGYLADIITIKRVLREKGEVYPEQRLTSLIPGFWLSPLGCIIVAITCANKLSWVGIAFGFGLGKYSNTCTI